MQDVVRQLSVVFQKNRLLSQIYWFAKYLKKDPYGVGETARGRYLDVLSLIPADAFANVLELGCGEGAFTALLADRAACVMATDISITAIQRARRRLRGLDHVFFRVENICDRILGKSDYSLVICLELLYYVPRDRLDECIGKIVMQMRVGGYVLFGHRREIPQSSGIFRIPFGAESIHAHFREIDDLVCMREVERPGYLLSLYKRLK